MGNADSRGTAENQAPVVVYSKTTCPYCVKAKNLLQDAKIDYVAYELNKMNDGAEVAADLRKRTGLNYVPQIFVCGQLIGGFGDLTKLHEDGKLRQMVSQCSKPSSRAVR